MVAPNRRNRQPPAPEFARMTPIFLLVALMATLSAAHAQAMRPFLLRAGQTQTRS